MAALGIEDAHPGSSAARVGGNLPAAAVSRRPARRDDDRVVALLNAPRAAVVARIERNAFG